MPLSCAVVGERGDNGSETTGRRQARMLGPVAQGEIQQVGMRLSAQAEALAALAAALRLRQSKSEAASEVQAALDEVVAALGLTDALESASPGELAAALAPIRALFLQANDLLTDPARAPGWSYTDADVLESLGRTSAGFAGVLQDTVAPQLDGLEERLAAEGASFLDVGVGVAGLAIAMAGQWPNLRVVGIDPWEPSLALARANVSAAGLDDRIELRGARVEELDDRHRFDLAFLPAPFLPRSVLDGAVGRLRETLRPGGWVVVGLYRGRDRLDEALALLRAARSGGSSPTPSEVVGLLRGAGFEQAGEFPAELGISSALAVGRRP